MGQGRIIGVTQPIAEYIVILEFLFAHVILTFSIMLIKNEKFLKSF